MRIQEITLSNSNTFMQGINGVAKITKRFRTYKIYFTDNDVLTVPKRNVLCRINGTAQRQVVEQEVLKNTKKRAKQG